MTTSNFKSSSLSHISKCYVRDQVKRIESNELPKFNLEYNQALILFFKKYFSKNQKITNELLTLNLIELIKSPKDFNRGLPLSYYDSKKIFRLVEKKLLVEGNKSCQIHIFSILNANNFEKFFSDKKSLNIPKEKFLEYCTTKVVDFHRKNPSAKIFKLNTKNIEILFQRFQKKQQHFHRIPVATVLESIPYTSPNSDARANSRIIPSATVREAIPTGDVSQQKLFARAGGIVPLTTITKAEFRQPILSQKSIRRYLEKSEKR